jgi:hypothetical protein
MVHRLVDVPLSHANFIKELNTIYTIAENNGYNIEMVDDILRKVQKKKTMDNLYSPGNLNKTPLTFKKIRYLPNLPHKLFSEFKRSSISPAFYNRFNVKNSLVNNKIDKKKPLEETGVYKFECQSCEEVYIGQSGRSFTTRIKEHMAHNRNVRPEKSNSLESKHQVKADNLKILHKEAKGTRLNTLEAFEINNHLHEGSTLLNEQLDLNSSPILRIPPNYTM